MNGDERQRWERVRRAFLNLVAQLHAADPASRYTLDIRVIQRDQTASKIA